jgi:hypothetical protein
MDDLKERLMRKAEHKSEVQHMPESSTLEGKALAYIEALEQHVSELEGLCKEALAFVERTEARNMRFDVGYGVFTKGFSRKDHLLGGKLYEALNREPNP